MFNLLKAILFPLTGNYSCFEWGNCTTNGHLFEVITMPYSWSLGDFAPVAIWGLLIAVIWKRSHSMMLTGIIGVLINAAFVFYQPARIIGWLLLAVAAGITLFQLVTLRPHGGSSN